MKKIIRILLGVTLLSGLALGYGCSNTPSDTPAASSSPASTAPVIYSTPPSAVTANAGEQFVIYIESNPSTGYSWSLASGMDEKVIKLVTNETISAATPMPGAPGQQKFTFSAASKGQTTITLNYARPWETNVTPVKTQTIFVTVK